MASGFTSFQNVHKEAFEILGKFYFQAGLAGLKQGKSECKEAFTLALESGFDVKAALQENKESITASKKDLKEFQKIIIDKIYNGICKDKSRDASAGRL